MPRPQVIVQIFGGLGNQLFQYAMGRRLALANDVPLVLDHISGFARDFYRRKYTLDKFNIQGCKIGASPYLSVAGRVRRRLDRWMNRGRSLEQKSYVEERPAGVFNPGLLDCKIRRRVYFEGYWQYEDYFADIAETIREDLRITSAHDVVNIELARRISAVNAVCLHVRRLRRDTVAANVQTPGARDKPPVDVNYYQRALNWMAERVPNPHFFVFADHPDWAREHVQTPFPVEFVTHNGPGKDYEDFWLMTQCRHFVIASSTFSWWAAWLGVGADKLVVAPQSSLGNLLVSIPPRWVAL